MFFYKNSQILSPNFGCVNDIYKYKFQPWLPSCLSASLWYGNAISIQACGGEWPELAVQKKPMGCSHMMSAKNRGSRSNLTSLSYKKS